MRIATAPAPVNFADTLFAAVKLPGAIGPHLIAGPRLGAPDGYSSLADALDGMAAATADEAPAAVLFERDGRFYGQVAEATLGGGDEDFHLSEGWQREFTLKVGTNAAAIVDGAIRLVNDGSLPKWSTISRKYFQMVEDSYRKPRRPF
jgi:hypothetical protein